MFRSRLPKTNGNLRTRKETRGTRKYTAVAVQRRTQRTQERSRGGKNETHTFPRPANRRVTTNQQTRNIPYAKDYYGKTD